MSDSSSENSSICDEDRPNTRTELGQNMSEMVNILSDLFKLSYQIRNPATRSTEPGVLKPLAHKEIMLVNDTTSVDLLACYSDFDIAHVKEHFRQLRREIMEEKWEAADSQDLQDIPETVPASFLGALSNDLEWANKPGGYLISRWAKATTNRRRYFSYWRRHARKLAQEDKVAENVRPASNQPYDLPIQPKPGSAPSQIILQNQPKATLSNFGGTVMSGTEATRYSRRLDDDIDAQSTVSYSSTAYDLGGNIADLPSPPKLRSGQLEFTCSFCHITSPVKYARGKEWR